MRVEVGQAGPREGVLKYGPDGTRAGPVLTVEPRCLEMPGVPDHDFRRGEKRIVQAPKLLFPKVIDPIDDDLMGFVNLNNPWARFVATKATKQRKSLEFQFYF
jgi:hypothetical protein